MSYLQINPRYQHLLERHGLRAPEDFFALPAVIISGHPDRNVSRIVLERPGATVHGYLKREHCLRWKDRVLNALAGFGLVSKSRRECAMLEAFARKNIGCADWIAVGEDGFGRAFLLVGEVEEAQDLRAYLRDHLRAHPRARRRFAVRLGGALARLHNAGFDHPDLYSKHIVVQAEPPRIGFLDIQRSRRWRTVPWQRRWRDLAALEATLGEDHLPTADRVACLRAYLRICRVAKVPRVVGVLYHAFRITRLAAGLASQRRIEEIRNGPPSDVCQQLVWLNDEALCVTPALQLRVGGRLPDWLTLDSLPPRPCRIEVRQTVALPEIEGAVLVRRRERRLLAAFWSWLSRRRLTSPELRQSGVLFRLQRAGIRTPVLLGFGQRNLRPWRTESFLLTHSAGGASLSRWWNVHADSGATGVALLKQRRLIEEIGRLLRQLHEAGCDVDPKAFLESLRVLEGPPSESGCSGASPGTAEQCLALADVEHVYTSHRAKKQVAKANLTALRQELGSILRTRADQMRLLFAYLGLKKLNPAARRLARSFLQAPRPAATFPASGKIRAARDRARLIGRGAAL
jgi:tRNA A-37 threonylcarbamoyl transferase component Bud32